MLLRALFAFLLLPGLAAFILPPLLARLDPWSRGVFLPGSFVLCLGAVLLLWCVRDLYVSGKGTLAPWDPPRKLVVVGLYRYVRNPMYVGVLTVTAGWTVFLASPVLAGYTLVLALGFHLRVLKYEEPWLAGQFGHEWLTYRALVNRWRPRLRPWKGRPD